MMTAYLKAATPDDLLRGAADLAQPDRWVGDASAVSWGAIFAGAAAAAALSLILLISGHRAGVVVRFAVGAGSA